MTDMEKTASAQGGRLRSLDAFRGFDMLMILGFDAVMLTLAAWIWGNEPNWLHSQFSHREWFGLSFYDMIFPTFLFIAGISFPFSYAKQVERGVSSLAIHLRILRRAVTLIALGVVINGFFKFDFAHLRYASVLGKIGMAWAIAAILYIHFGLRTRIAICAALVVGYGVLLRTVVAPDFPDASSLSLEGNFLGWLDRHFMPGYLYEKNLFDPSGIHCNFFSVPTAMFGIFAGEIVRSARMSGNRKTLALLAFAAGLLVAGLAGLPVMPLSKRLWTPTFTLVVGAYSTAAFALFYWLIDVKGWRGWATFFTVIGVNSIAAYFMISIVDFQRTSWYFLRGFASFLPEAGANWLYACGRLAVLWLVLWYFNRNKTYFKV